MIRPARIEDIPQLAAHGHEFYILSAISKFVAYDADALAKSFKAMIESPSVGFFVIPRGDNIVGGAAVVLAPLFFSAKESMAQEVFWYVDDQHRGTPDSLRLFAALENWARQKGAAVIMMAALASNPGVGTLYQRRGYVPQESNYIKPLKETT